MQEEWKDIEGFEGMYQVSNLGRVKSLARFKRKEDKIIKGNPNQLGYLQVQLYKDRKRHIYMVHRLVLQAFDPISNPEEMTGNHKDFNVQNNALGNLEWCTTLENNRHYWDNADLEKREELIKEVVGEKHHLAKLTEDGVREIRRLYFNDIVTSMSEIARILGVSEGTIRSVIDGKTWWRVK